MKKLKTSVTNYENLDAEPVFSTQLPDPSQHKGHLTVVDNKMEEAKIGTIQGTPTDRKNLTCGEAASSQNTMADVSVLGNQLVQARNELNNLRKKMHALRAQHQKDIASVKRLLEESSNQQMIPLDTSRSHEVIESPSSIFHQWNPIGHLQTWFHSKNGTPRQGTVSSLSRGVLAIDKQTFNNPEHSLQGLQEYSHVWIFFVFDRNGEGMKGKHSKSKVAPPRLNGEKLGVFATRSPHRPNPLGLTLAKLEKIEGNCLHLSGLDILDGTPVIDIKPYIPEYDSPSLFRTIVASESDPMLPKENSDSYNTNKVTEVDQCDDEISNVLSANSGKIKDYDSKNEKRSSEECDVTVEEVSNKSCDSEKLKEGSRCFLRAKRLIDGKQPGVDESVLEHLQEEQTITQNMPTSSDVKTAVWLNEPLLPSLNVVFHPLAEKCISEFSSQHLDAAYRLKYLQNNAELRMSIENILSEDPRSSYRRKKCSSSLYYFDVDNAHITAWFDGNMAEVLRVCPSIHVKGTDT